MTEYHKINAIYKRHTSGPEKGRLIEGDWAVPEIGYLANNEWEFTEKVDGTNIRIELTLSAGTSEEKTLDVQYKGRTNNADIPKPLLLWLEEYFPTFPQWRRDLERPAFHGSYDRVKNWMLDNDLSKVVLYGEGYGPKIQSGGNYRKDQSFVLFDVKIGDFWLDRANVNDIAQKLGIDSVPVLGYGTIYQAIWIVKYGMAPVGWNYPLEVSPKIDGLKSAWGDFEAEGIVARPVVPLFNRKGERIIAKIKARDFRA